MDEERKGNDILPRDALFGEKKRGACEMYDKLKVKC